MQRNGRNDWFQNRKVRYKIELQFLSESALWCGKQMATPESGLWCQIYSILYDMRPLCVQVLKKQSLCSNKVIKSEFILCESCLRWDIIAMWVWVYFILWESKGRVQKKKSMEISILSQGGTLGIFFQGNPPNKIFFNAFLDELRVYKKKKGTYSDLRWPIVTLNTSHYLHQPPLSPIWPLVQ